MHRTPTVTVRNIKLYPAHSDEYTLAQVLEDGLKSNFMDVEVKWVDCPDLTEEPFNLAASGLCGETALLDFGNMSYLKPHPRMEKIYDIKKFLKYIGRNSKDSFIFGGGISQRPSNGKLGEFVMNKMFSSTMDVCNNKSRIIFINQEQRKCDVEMLSDSHLECNIQGSFFLSEGLTAPVLQVRAKKYNGNKYPGFISSMQCALQQVFKSTGHLVVLGGVHVSYNQVWRHKLKSYDWECAPFDTRLLCKVEEPSPIISIFSSTTQLIPSFLESPLRLNFTKCVYNLSHHSAGGYHYHHELSLNDGAEFLGYYYPADEIYRIDE